MHINQVFPKLTKVDVRSKKGLHSNEQDTVKQRVIYMEPTWVLCGQD